MTIQSSDSTQPPPAPPIVIEEERCLERVRQHAEEKRANKPEEKKRVNYDQQLLEIRDEIAASRMEDVPPLLEQMERLQGIAARQRQLTTGFIDTSSPYFGRMVLEENGRRREVLIGRSTYLDSKEGVRIVDWRDAPVSRLYYRYAEGDEYEETFGERELEGEVLVRRSLTIVEGRLRRIVSPQGTYLRPENGQWTEGGPGLKLAGGQGRATRAEQHKGPRKLGVGEAFDSGEDKHLREITALIDQRQFELITKPDSGLVVIQGGAGSGKTTIGLHRLAYLAYQDARRFRPDKMLVVVFNNALARYISQVLPALDVGGVAVKTYQDWAARLRYALVPGLTKLYSDETPQVVTRLKKHPGFLQAIDDYVQHAADEIEERLLGTLAQSTQTTEGETPLSTQLSRSWHSSKGRPLVHRLHALKGWMERNSARLTRGQQHTIERELSRGKERYSNLVHVWAELLTDRKRIEGGLAGKKGRPLSAKELDLALEWCNKRCTAVISEMERREDAKQDEPKANKPDTADGEELEERATVDLEDDTIFLLLWQRISGALRKPGTKEPLVYEHVLVDEAQDLSPLEMSVVIGCVSRAQSITLAGDVAQKLHMDNGFSGWDDTLGELGLSHVQVEPLRLAYRSTAEIVEFSREVLGELADEQAPEATRNGAPVELFRFADLGDSCGFLAEALRELVLAEPRASVAVIARHPQQADLVHMALLKAETPKLRRIANQDFPFKPGIDVTDIRQVKGLEFDYVVLVEVSASTYPDDEASRHLLHIGGTRAAHQLWLLASGKPSPLLPEALRSRSY